MPSEASRPDRESSRDRDALGRPRNARPRDGLGRPLPRGSIAGVERVPDELAMPLDDAVALAQQYLDTDRPFHAHEVLEALWKTQPVDERDLWQGLAQVAVGITHALRGNSKGAIELLNRGSGRVRGYTGDRHGIAVGQVLTETQSFIEMVRAGDNPQPKRFRLHLR
jgi:uncharacterized protein